MENTPLHRHPLGHPVAALPEHDLEKIVRAALEEDFGAQGDITSATLIPEKSTSSARIVARQTGVLCGMDAARMAFRLVDAKLDCKNMKQDGEALQKGDVIATLQGSSRSILATERVALNFLTHLSGISSLTALYVKEVAGTKAVIACTRKTHAGLRHLEKYAVAQGGGANHRFGLFDGVLIKDNHVAASGSVQAAVTHARAYVGGDVKIEVEVDRFEQIDEALQAGADIIMLDNFETVDMKRAVAHIKGRAFVEASGGVNLQTVRAIAQTGVDVISIGALTHSAPALDIGLDF